MKNSNISQHYLRHSSAGVSLSRTSLTQKQQKVLLFIQGYFDEHKRSPLIREIQSGCQIASYKSALDRLNALERKGLIKRTPSRHRGIRLARKLFQEPAPLQEALAGTAESDKLPLETSEGGLTA